MMTLTPHSKPETPEELQQAAADYAETVDINAPVSRVSWEVSMRAKDHAGRIEVHLLNGLLCNPVTITLTWDAYQELGWERMKSTIRHELIHLWEYDTYGESSHDHRFKQKADELGADLTCGQFVQPRYELACSSCGHHVGERHNRSKLVKAPEKHASTACECISHLEVTDRETGASWTSWWELKNQYEDADTLTEPYRYELSCAGCGYFTDGKDELSKAVLYPSHYYCGDCACETGIRVRDTRTGETWESNDAYNELG